LIVCSVFEVNSSCFYPHMKIPYHFVFNMTFSLLVEHKIQRLKQTKFFYLAVYSEIMIFFQADSENMWSNSSTARPSSMTFLACNCSPGLVVNAPYQYFNRSLSLCVFGAQLSHIAWGISWYCVKERRRFCFKKINNFRRRIKQKFVLQII